MKKILLKPIKLLKKLLFLRLELLFYNIDTLLLFQIIFKLLSVFIVSPIIYLIIEQGLAIVGNDYINDENLISVLTNPVIVIFILILIILLAFNSVFSFSALLYIFEKSRRKERTKLLKTAKFALYNALRLFIPKNLTLILYVLILMPLFNIGVVTSSFGGYSIPVEITDYISANHWLSVAFLVTFGLIYIFTFKLFYTMQYFTLEQKNALSSYNESIHLNRSNRIMNMLSMLCLQALLAIINSIFVFVANILMSLTYNTSIDSNTIIQIIVFTITIIFFILFFVISCLYTPLSSLKAASIYYSNKENSFQEMPNINLDNIADKSKPIGWIKNHKKISTITISFILIVLLFYGASNIFSSMNNDTKYSAETNIIEFSQFSTNTEIYNDINKAKNDKADMMYFQAFITSDDQIMISTSSNATYTLSNLDINTEDMSFTELEDFLNSLEKDDLNYKMKYSLKPIKEVVEYCNDINLGMLIDTTNISKDYENIISNEIKDQNLDSIILTSKNMDSLKILKSISKNINTSYKQTIAFGDFSEFKEFVDYIMIDNISFEENQTDLFHENGYGVIVYGMSGLDDKDKIKQCQKSGCEYIGTIMAPFVNKILEEGNKEEFITEAYKKYEVLNIFKELI